MKARVIHVGDEQPYWIVGWLTQERAIVGGRGAANHEISGRIRKMRDAGAVKNRLSVINHLLFAEWRSRAGQQLREQAIVASVHGGRL